MYMGPRFFQNQIRGLKMCSAPTKMGVSYNFCFIKFSPNRTVEAAEARQTPFRAPWHWGLGYGVKSQLQTFPPLRSIPMPNFIEISPVVWISIPDIHAHTHWLLYIRRCLVTSCDVIQLFAVDRSLWHTFFKPPWSRLSSNHRCLRILSYGRKK